MHHRDPAIDRSSADEQSTYTVLSGRSITHRAQAISWQVSCYYYCNLLLHQNRKNQFLAGGGEVRGAGH
jgi:hypothetical protein